MRKKHYTDEDLERVMNKLRNLGPSWDDDDVDADTRPYPKLVWVNPGTPRRRLRKGLRRDNVHGL
jgi:hypothetical protein